MGFNDFIKENGQTATYEKGEPVFEQGEKNLNLYLVTKGLLKAYYLLESGKTHVKSFIQSGEMIGSLSAFYSKDLTSYSLTCLEKSEVVSLSFDSIYDLCKRDLETANFIIELLLKLAMKKEKREFEFLCLSAQERYEVLQKDNPGLLKQVTQNDIAQYLGVTPVALSRIKKRLN